MMTMIMIMTITATADWDDEDDELMDDNRAVESFGSWILNLTDLKSEPAGTESCIIPYPASEAASLKL